MRSTPHVRRNRLTIAGFFAAALLGGAVQPAVAQVTIKQLTNDPNGPANNSTANPVTNGFITLFESNLNFDGFNPELNSEVWRHRDDSGLIPLTGCTLGNSRIPGIGGEIPLPAFTSSCDLAGSNPDGNTELFFLTAGAQFQQITNTAGLGVLALDINEFANTFAFLSDGDFRGQNGDANVEVFVYERSDGLFRQLTNTITGINNSGGISMDPTGTWVTFPSRNDLTGGNPDANTEIFLVEVSTNATTQITSTMLDGNVSPVVALRNGNPVVAFSSTANFAGANPERNQEIFVWNDGTITPVTSTGSSVNDLPSLDDSGTRIAFVSNANLTGGNSDLSGEIFVFDNLLGTTVQITDVSAPGQFLHGRPSMAPSGLVVVFASSADLTGENADKGPEIFRAVTIDSPCDPTTGQVNIIAGTAGDDFLRGTLGRDYIFGLDGNDRIIGADGDDCVDGGGGNDRIVGNSGADEIHGGDDNDILVGTDGNDELYGEEGIDAFHGGPGSDTCVSEPGETVIACEL